MLSLVSLLLFAAPEARAYVDPACEGQTQALDDQGQQDFLLNFFALATTFSPLHGPVPHEPGHGSIGLRVSVIPPLSCERRLVLDSTKTEDTNKAPVAPQPTLTFAFPKLGPAVVYGGVGYVPPVTVFGTRNVIMSGEVGVGFPLENGLELGARYHATLMKTIAEIATPFVEGDPAYDDFFSGSTLGFDLMAGYNVKGVKPYVAVGVLDASTFFLVGDDIYIGESTTPFLGLATSVGAQTLLLNDRLNLAAEFYTAYDAIPPIQESEGRIFTGRARVGFEF
ncbi:MAG: hypothetical protein H6739_15110 [Alphaproteobacteria bacterium]|nr:hypothetical protein [Alphaproteobacteria bacterium]